MVERGVRLRGENKSRCLYNFCFFLITYFELWYQFNYVERTNVYNTGLDLSVEFDSSLILWNNEKDVA